MRSFYTSRGLAVENRVQDQTRGGVRRLTPKYEVRSTKEVRNPRENGKIGHSRNKSLTPAKIFPKRFPSSPAPFPSVFRAFEFEAGGRPPDPCFGIRYSLRPPAIEAIWLQFRSVGKPRNTRNTRKKTASFPCIPCVPWFFHMFSLPGTLTSILVLAAPGEDFGFHNHPGLDKRPRRVIPPP
jgi:hypothetical protein